MALSQDFTSAESSTGTTIYVDDSTGNYDVNNEGGYGSPNTERSSLALIATLTYKEGSGDIEQTIQAYDPETVDRFEWQGIEADSNGWFQAKIYTFAIKTGSEAPSEGDYVYNGVSNELERYDGSAWVGVLQEDYKAQLEGDGVSATETIDHLHLSGYYRAFNYLVKLIVTGCNCKSRNDLRSYKSEVKEQLEGFRIHFFEGNRIQAQKDAERYQERIAEFLTLE